MTNAGPQTTATTSAPHQPYKLMRARKGRMVAGVSAGLARSAGMDVTMVRLLIAASFFAGGLGLIAYGVLWIVLPDEQPSRGRVIEEAPENTARTIRVILVVAALLGVLRTTGVF